jgi:hypothetical protein
VPLSALFATSHGKYVIYDTRRLDFPLIRGWKAGKKAENDVFCHDSVPMWFH